MNFDLSEYPPIVQQIAGYGVQGYELAMGWLLSPAAWSQFGILVGAYLLAVLITRRMRPALQKLVDPAGKQNLFTSPRLFVLQFLPLVLPLLAYLLTGFGERIVRSLFDSGAVIAFGKRVFMFLAVGIFVRAILKAPFLSLLGGFMLIPIAALYMLGMLDVVTLKLTETIVGVGNIRFSLISVVRGLIAGSLLFWLGQWANSQTSSLIQKHEIRTSLRKLFIKVVELMILESAFILWRDVMGINLGAISVRAGVIGVGVGCGRQKVD